MEFGINMEGHYIVGYKFYPNFPARGEPNFVEGRGRALLEVIYKLFPGFEIFYYDPGPEMVDAIPKMEKSKSLIFQKSADAKCAAASQIFAFGAKGYLFHSWIARFFENQTALLELWL
jgi:hypothetical protein